MRRQEPSPLAPVGPDDPPRSFCHKHNRKYNPYKHSKCPECKGEEAESDVPVVDPSDPETW